MGRSPHPGGTPAGGCCLWNYKWFILYGNLEKWDFIGWRHSGEGEPGRRQPPLWLRHEAGRRLRPSPHAPQTPHQPPRPRFGGSLSGGPWGDQGLRAVGPARSLRSLMRAAIERTGKKEGMNGGKVWPGGGAGRRPRAGPKRISAGRGNPSRLTWGALPPHSPYLNPPPFGAPYSLPWRSLMITGHQAALLLRGRPGRPCGPIPDFAVAPLPQPPSLRLLHPQSEKTRFYRVFALTSAWERETAAKNSLIRYNDAY